MSGEPDTEEMREEQQLNRWSGYHQTNLASGNPNQELSFNELKAQYLDKLTETGLSDAGTQLLDNMIDPSFVLGYLTEANVQEIKWRMHSMYIKITGLFPCVESGMQGPLRAFVYDDPDENLTSLNEQQKVIISQMIIGISVWVSRSKQGFQQEINAKSISESIVRNPEKEEEGLVRGLFS